MESPATKSSRLRWGILATGGIAKTFADGVCQSDSGELLAVASRELNSARAFAQTVHAPRAYGSYRELLADPEVEAVYIATPHPMHAEWAVRAAEAGKHVLCEKPIGINAREARDIFGAAQKAGVLAMEAFMYRCHPQTLRAVEIVRTGLLGTIGSVQAAFSFHNRSELTSRFYSRELGGGGILDVGCYPVSFARLIAGAAAGMPFLDPVDVRAVGQLHPATGVDLYTAAVLRFESGMIAEVATGIALHQDSSARIYGSKGWLHVPEPWLPGVGGRVSRLVLHLEGENPREIDIDSSRPMYALEADAFARALRGGRRSVPEMSPEDTIGNLQAMDRWREEIGLTYPADER